VKHGFSAVALHGDMDQRSRMNALEAFRNGEITLLVASDVAARGLDIPDVSHIFNFDIPHHPEDYVHRIGRTGRAGRSGAALTLVAPADKKSLVAIEKLIGQSIPWDDRPVAASESAAASSDDERPHRHESREGREGRNEHRGERGGRNRSRGGKSRRSHKDTDGGQPTAQAVAPREARPEPARESRPELAGGDTSHLPAFLLRPVPLKAS
jgi:superfamily II DNA/RNA helicase